MIVIQRIDFASVYAPLEGLAVGLDRFVGLVFFWCFHITASFPETATSMKCQIDIRPTSPRSGLVQRYEKVVNL